jgi:hypothetical protein
VDAARQQFPEARIVINDHQRTPLELASRAIRECRGEVILVTKDHCIPSQNWVRALTDALQKGRAAVGGRIEIDPGSSAVEWAFQYVDFYRYGGPNGEGPAEFLSVCNVAYKRTALNAIRELWQATFVETTINDALRVRFGVLWRAPEAKVTLCRAIGLREALRERYAYGRLFGYSRLAGWSGSRRVAYAILAPALPVVMLVRMAAAASASAPIARKLARALAPLTLLILARCWGEWLAYITGRYPRTWNAPEA